MTVRDQERFDFIYRKYYKKLLRTAVNMLQNVPAAEDLTNETFTILLTRFDRMQQHPNIGGWLYTVLSNLALNEIKKWNRCILLPDETLCQIGDKSDILSFADLLPAGLSNTDKEILRLRYLQNLNCAEIAQKLKISHDASRARLFRAKRHYAAFISKEEIY